MFLHGGRTLCIHISAGSGIVFVSILYEVVAPWAHFMPGRAEGIPGFIKGNVCGGIFRRFCPAIDVNQRIDIPAFQQFIGWDVVVSGIKADIFREQPAEMRLKSSMA